MKYDGTNLAAVLNAHMEWVCSAGENGDRADFTGASLQGLDMSGVCLYGAVLRGTDFFRTVLCHADLRKADMAGANLRETCLEHAQLCGALNVPHIPLRVPDSGAFIGWKRVALAPEICAYERTGIAKLQIPEDARPTSNLNGECRADRAIVLEIQALDGTPLPGASGWAIRDRQTRYTVGETIICPNYGEERFTPWTPGIYFYPDREEAVQYLTQGRDADGKVKLYNWDSLFAQLEEKNHRE